MAMTTSPNFQSGSKPLGGRYRLMQPLGEGGFGRTFEAQDLHLPGRPLCVVKQLKPQVASVEELQVARRLFDTEAQVLYKLGSHPQIPGLLAHFEEDEEFYLAQEYIQGHSLADELESGTPWTAAQVVTLLGDLLGILTFVHGNGVIHRDIKPSNLIRRSSDRRLVLIDFGAVKQVSAQLTTQRSGLSHTISIGTQGYMASEQLAGRPQFSSDIYAVGILGIQALTGYPPTQFHPDPSSGELDWQRYAPQAPPDLRAVLDQMVRYDFRTRYTTATEALAALQTLPAGLRQHIPATIIGAGANVSPVGRTQANPTVAVGRRPVVTQARVSQAVPQPRRSRLSWPGWLAIVAVTAVALGGLLSWQLTASNGVDEETTAATIPPVENEAESTAEESSDSSGAEPTPEPAPEPTPEPVAELSAAEPAEVAPTPEPEVAPAPPAADPPTEAPSPESLTPAAAQTTVANLYGHVTNQSWEAARAQFGGALAQQFDPSFFAQFTQVSVENLRVTGQTADTIELLGENTYVYPDGSTQREERTFTVQTIEGQPRIVASNFRRVLKQR